MSDSPLTSASPDSLTVLFDSDPMTLTDSQILAAVTELRRRRNVFASEEAAKALAPKRTRAKAEPASTPLDKPTSEIGLEDL